MLFSSSDGVISLLDDLSTLAVLQLDVILTNARKVKIVPEYPENRQLNRRLNEFRKEYDAKLASVHEILSPDIVELVLNNVYFEGVAQKRTISLVDYARMINIGLYNSARQSYTTYKNKESGIRVFSNWET